MPARTEKQSPLTVQHVVHVREGPPAGFIEMRRLVWTVRVDAAQPWDPAHPKSPELSRIDSFIAVAPRPMKFKKRADLRAWQALVDAVTITSYGSSDQNVHRRVDDLARRIRGGWLPATRGAAGQVKKQHPRRAAIRQMLRDLLWILHPPALMGRSVWFRPTAAKASTPLAGLWAQLQAAHRTDADVEELDPILDALARAYPPLDSARRRAQLHRILSKRVHVGDADLDEATRFGFEDPESLAVAIVALVCRCSRKTVRRVGADLLSAREK